jgi:alkaline phosphatase D
MSFGRRDILKAGLVQAALSTVPLTIAVQAKERAPPVRRQGPSVVQGATDETSTQFSVVHDAQTKIRFEVRNSKGEVWQPDRVEELVSSGQVNSVSRAFFSRLYPNEVFSLNLIDSGNTYRREFKTLDLSKLDLRMAICSCMDETRHEPQIWREIVQQQPDLILFIGDCVYVDGGAVVAGETYPQRLWRRFAESRGVLEIYYSKRLIPIIAVWDDHDFGVNDGWSNFPYVAESQKNFRSFFAQEANSILEQGPGVSSAIRIASHLILLMDDRTYRLEPGSKNRYAHWGSEQEEWALSAIENHKGPVWIMNGSQIFPAMIWKESMSGHHPVQFIEFMKMLAKTKKKVIFASGDVHFSEISQIENALLGYRTFEVTSSAVHSRHMPGFPEVVPNKRRLMATGRPNYVMVSSRADGDSADVLIESYSSHCKLNFTLKTRV